VGEKSEQEGFVQHYRVQIFVNHAMSHLCTLKDEYELHGKELPNVLLVGPQET
jgi:hypothetical protein